MLFIHPKKWLRKIQKLYEMYLVWSFKKKVEASGVQVEIGDGVRLVHCQVSSHTHTKREA